MIFSLRHYFRDVNRIGHFSVGVSGLFLPCWLRPSVRENIKQRWRVVGSDLGGRWTLTSVGIKKTRICLASISSLMASYGRSGTAILNVELKETLHVSGERFVAPHFLPEKIIVHCHWPSRFVTWLSLEESRGLNVKVKHETPYLLLSSTIIHANQSLFLDDTDTLTHALGHLDSN